MWISGDVIVSRPDFVPGTNSGKVIFNGETLYGLDTNVDAEGNLDTMFAAISTFPINFFSGCFDFTDAKGNTTRNNIIEHNSAIFCDVLGRCVATKRKNIMLKVNNDESIVDVTDRCMVIVYNNIKYGIICEYGLVVPEIKETVESAYSYTKCKLQCTDDVCSSKELKCKKSGYVQFMRFKPFDIKKIKQIVSKSSFLNRVMIYSNSTYKVMIDFLMEEGVAPNNIAFVDSKDI